MRRRLLKILGFILAGALLLVATVPWWMEPVARRVAHRFGADFKRYERLGYTRFALHDVLVTQASVTVRVSRVETETPVIWSFHHVVGKPALIAATDWRVEVVPSANPSPPNPDSGAMRLREILFKVANALDRWIPHAVIGPGIVTWKGGELRLDAAEWKDRTLAVHPLRFAGQTAEVTANFSTTDVLQIDARADGEFPWSAALKSLGNEIDGELSAWEQPAKVGAKFAPRGWMPGEATLRADAWAIPGSALKLGAYSTIRGGAHLDWTGEKFSAGANAAGEVEPGKKTPPLSVNVNAGGDLRSVTINVLAVEIPGMNAKLDAPVTFARDAAGNTGPTNFMLELDLAQQPWIPDAKGRLTGKAQVLPVSGKPPRVEASVEAREIAVEGWTIERFVAAPVFDWPLVRVQGARLNFGNGSELVANGAWDFQAAELVGAELHGNIGATAVRQLLPAVVDFRNLQIDANAHGPLAALQHDGTIAATGVKASVLKPLDSKLVWVGRGASADISDGTVTAGKSRLQFAGKVDATGVELKTLEWTESSAERLTLREPAAVSWSPAIRVGPVKLRGPGGALELTAMFGETGRLQTTVRDFSSRWLGDFIDVPGPEWRVGHLDLEGSWDRGPAKFDLNGALTVTLAPERFADVTVAARTNPTNDAVLVEPLRVLEGDSAIVNATGEIPVAFYPATRPMLRFAPKAPLKLEATTASNPVFWKRLTEAIGVEFQEPEVNVNLGGTWENPRGEISARARRLAADSQRFKFSFPTIESLDVHATADGRKLDLDRLSVKVEGQALRANGMLPLSLERWPELRRAPLDFLRQEANLRLEIPDAEVAALSRYVGNYLAPAGNLHVDLQFNPGGEMSGALRLRNAATRPLGPLGVLQEVQVDAQLSGRDLVVKNVTAQAGGQPVTLSGKVEIPVGTPPRFDLALRAENFPLVRQTGLLMRADLDLRLKTQAGDVTAVTGEVNLRDSMFLSDVRALIPKGGGGGPTRRPPFFSIEFPPLDAWRLSVDVQGQEFLRLRSAVFVGTASARFHVGGTLGEPRATGEAVVETGQVLLPFATFQVEQGTVRLTEADPFSLQLFLTGQARRYGYDLRMELSGTASDPLVTFSSSPPLEAKEVLLMVTAGEVPRDEMTYGTAQRAAKLGTYLGQSLINNFGGDATDADRLTISTGERVSRQGRETYNIEYRINDRLTAIGEYDEFDAYNAGLKWRLFAPKRTERNPPKPPAPASPKKTNDAAR